MPRLGKGLAAILGATALLAVACGNSSPTSESTNAATGGEPDGPVEETGDVPEALDLAVTDLEGNDFDPASVEGSGVVLWFWAPWCSTCRAEAPNVVSVSEEFDGQVEIIGVASRGDVAEMEGFVDDTGTGGMRHLVDLDGAIWSQFEVISQPAFAFIGPDGEVREVFIGPLGEHGLTERISGLSGE